MLAVSVVSFSTYSASTFNGTDRSNQDRLGSCGNRIDINTSFPGTDSFFTLHGVSYDRKIANKQPPASGSRYRARDVQPYNRLTLERAPYANTRRYNADRYFSIHNTDLTRPPLLEPLRERHLELSAVSGVRLAIPLSYQSDPRYFPPCWDG